MNARKKSDRYNMPAELHNYILSHQHDRKVTVTVWMSSGKSRISITRLRSSTTTSSHTSMTGRGRFSHCSDEYREKSDRYNSPADLYNYILQHQYDRKGTFQLLFG